MTSDIEEAKNHKVLHLTTKGRKTGRPHTVEIWFAYDSNHKKLYLSHEGSHPDWMKNLENDGQVKAKIGSLRFDATARIVKEGESFELGKKSLYEKYYHPASKEVIDDWFSLSTVVEVTRWSRIIDSLSARQKIESEVYAVFADFICLSNSRVALRPLLTSTAPEEIRPIPSIVER